MGETKPENRIAYLDYLRVLACLAVIVIHVTTIKWQEVSVHSGNWLVLNGYDALVRWSVPAFVMISGALFLDRTVSLKTLYRKNILRLCTAFLFWSLIYCFFGNLDVAEKLRCMKDMEPGEIIQTLFTGYNHMWFVLMMISIYICLPVLQKIAQDEKVLRYFLIVGFVAVFCINTVSAIEDAFFYAKPSRIFGLVRYYLGNMDGVASLNYIYYFLLGFYLSKREFGIRQRRLLYLAGVLGMGYVMGLNALFDRMTGVTATIFYDPFQLGVFFVTVALFVGLRYAKQRSAGMNRVVAVLSRYSFGAFLVHYLILNIVIRWCGFDLLSFTPVLSVPVLTGIVAVLSYGVSAILHRIPVAKKYLV